ncbi:hypothetical protein [Burkholderia sp. Bp8998]|uniref:hypothetical protein n=1 Tax=Burkholderia sp. Bp8998 TaxID=2184557 RepID=UPI00163A5AFE|nr:hypothetical protein [Burkholderia sp. Bp8998]
MSEEEKRWRSHWPDSAWTMSGTLVNRRRLLYVTGANPASAPGASIHEDSGVTELFCSAIVDKNARPLDAHVVASVERTPPRKPLTLT